MPKKRVSLQAKHLRQSRKRRIINMSVRAEVKTAVTKARTGITAKAGEAAQFVKLAAKTLDKATTKGVIHANKAARTKSRLTKRLNADKSPA